MPCRIRSLCQEQEDTKKDEESCQGHRASVSFEQETWAVIRIRWTAWCESLMSDETCRPTAEQFT
eukprot:10380033-Karenia_brevis.AAC.1